MVLGVLAKAIMGTSANPGVPNIVEGETLTGTDLQTAEVLSLGTPPATPA
jgi:hypothetical protein